MMIKMTHIIKIKITDDNKYPDGLGHIITNPTSNRAGQI